LLQSSDRRKEGANSADTSGINSSTTIPSEETTPTIIMQVIPVLEETFSISKKMNTENLTIQKVCKTKTEKVEINRRYEEVLVNGKKIEAFEEHDSVGDEMLSKVKEKIREGLDTIHHSKDHSKKDYSVVEQRESKRELIPLFDYESSMAEETEKVIPVYAEEIVISKRVVKLGEVLIKKNRVTVNNRIDVDIQKEKVTVQYPNGVMQQLTETE
jgi:stress response protein YsnF